MAQRGVVALQLCLKGFKLLVHGWGGGGGGGAIQDIEESSAALDVSEEGVPKTFVLMGAWDKPRNVCNCVCVCMRTCVRVCVCVCVQQRVRTIVYSRCCSLKVGVLHIREYCHVLANTHTTYR